MNESSKEKKILGIGSAMVGLLWQRGEIEGEALVRTFSKSAALVDSNGDPSQLEDIFAVRVNENIQRNLSVIRL